MKPFSAVHLDLKGVAFRPSYLPQLLGDLASQGVNAVLIEYEDLFPFDPASGIDVVQDRKTLWSRATLARFLALAKRHGIEVIPLQQCLGHFEYVFRWRRYRALALDRKYPSTVDIANPRAVALVHAMLRQVLEAHPDSRYVHLGMDEAHALVVHAKANKLDVVELFLSHLSSLCDLCEAHGKKPIIWSDMLEDHMNARSLRLFEKFRERVVLCPWDYGTSGETTSVGRIAGWRFSRRWLDRPEDPAAPAIGGGHTFIEDLPEAVRRVVGKDLRTRAAGGLPGFTSMFQADLWRRLGFDVLGAAALRCSTNLATLPTYNRQSANLRAWGAAVRRSGAIGLVGTSWARGTSWCPPGFSIDLTWPLIPELSRAVGRRATPFFAGVPAETVSRIVRTLGRCRVDWRLEEQTANEMDALAPRLKAHRFEWTSLSLMARAFALQRRAAYNIDEVDFFHANARPVESEWQRRLDEQRQTLRDIATLKSRIRAHFGKRYFGDAFDEWVNDLFDLYVYRIRDCRRICKQKKAVAARVYAR